MQVMTAMSPQLSMQHLQLRMMQKPKRKPEPKFLPPDAPPIAAASKTEAEAENDKPI